MVREQRTQRTARSRPAPVPTHAALARAYRAAIYQIDTHPPVVLRIGQPHAALPALRARPASGRQPRPRTSQRRPASGVFLTACNPRSQRLRPTLNARRMRALQRLLARRGLGWLPGRGRDPAGHWPDEPSLWIPGLALSAGLRLARRFGQHALVWCGPDTVAQLIWTRAVARRGPRAFRS